MNCQFCGSPARRAEVIVRAALCLPSGPFELGFAACIPCLGARQPRRARDFEREGMTWHGCYLSIRYIPRPPRRLRLVSPRRR